MGTWGNSSALSILDQALSPEVLCAVIRCGHQGGGNFVCLKQGSFQKFLESADISREMGSFRGRGPGNGDVGYEMSWTESFPSWSQPLSLGHSGRGSLTKGESGKLSPLNICRVEAGMRQWPVEAGSMWEGLGQEGRVGR